MADQASATERMIVRATPERCFDVALDFEHYPRWAADIKSVVVEARDAEGRGTVVTFRAAAFGRSTVYTLTYDYAEAPRGLSWALTKGDLTRKLDGRYEFTPAGDDTEVTYHLDVELIVPLPGFIKRRAEGKIIHTALKELRSQAEQ